MARLYALMQPDGSLLFARPKGGGWSVSDSRSGIEPRGRNLTVFLNGLDVLGLSASLPAKNEKEARRAAPYAIEDDLAETVEEAHVALANPDKLNPNQARNINVISSARLTEIVDALTDQNLQDAELVAAHSLLPQNNMVFEAPGLILGRLSGRSFAFDPSLGKDVLLGLLDSEPDVAIYGPQIASALGRSSEGAGANSLEALLVQLANWAESDTGFVRLRQGKFEARRPVDLEGFGQWKVAGILAAAASVGWFASVLLETHAMNTRVDQLDTLAQEFARTGWPELNGDVQGILAQSRNSNLNASETFIGLLDGSAALYDAIGQIDGSEIRTIRYDRARRQMTATVSFDNFGDVDRLTAILNTGGLSARSGDARQSGSRVIGDLTLEPAS